MSSAINLETLLAPDELHSFVNPASVAVVGASADPAKWGYWLTYGALKGMNQREVYLVNRAGINIAGVPTFTAVKDLPGVPELITVSVPGSAVRSVVEEGLALGTRAFLVISARVPDEEGIRELLDAHGAKMIGPNSLGIYSAQSDLQLMWGEMRPGSLAIVSQSGQLGSEIAAHGAKQGVGISRFVSLGNQINVHAIDVLHSLIHDGATQTVGLYMEDFSRGEELFQAITELRDVGKAVVLLTTGDSEASRDLAHSHTGAMTSSSELTKAACKASGAVQVRTPSELVRVAAAFDKGAVPRGKRIAIISDSGGQGGIAADEAERVGLSVPEFSELVQAELQELLPKGASVRNPIDLAGAGESDMTLYARLPELLAASGEVDAVVLSGYFGSYGNDTPSLIEEERDVARHLRTITDIPVLVHAMAPDSVVSIEMHQSGILVAERIEDMMGVLGYASQASGLPWSLDEYDSANFTLTDIVDQITVREALEGAGIPFPETRVVRTPEEAVEAAEELGGKLVLKAAWLEHKTEHDGVRLNLVGPQEVVDTFEEMQSRLGYGNYTLEYQDTREYVVEYIVSVRRDPGLGTIVTVGFGGTETELWRDIQVAIGPISQDTAREMIGKLKSAPLLDYWRGRPALAADDLAQLVSRLSLVLHHTELLTEVEINPVRVGVDSILAVDCLAVIREE